MIPWHPAMGLLALSWSNKNTQEEVKVLFLIEVSLLTPLECRQLTGPAQQFSLHLFVCYLASKLNARHEQN